MNSKPLIDPLNWSECIAFKIAMIIIRMLFLTKLTEEDYASSVHIPTLKGYAFLLKVFNFT